MNWILTIFVAFSISPARAQLGGGAPKSWNDFKEQMTRARSEAELLNTIDQALQAFWKVNSRLSSENAKELLVSRQKLCRASSAACLKIESILPGLCRASSETQDLKAEFLQNVFILIKDIQQAKNFLALAQRCEQTPSSGQFAALFELLVVVNKNGWFELGDEIVSKIEAVWVSPPREYNFQIDYINLSARRLEAIRPAPLGQLRRLFLLTEKWRRIRVPAEVGFYIQNLYQSGAILGQTNELKYFTESVAKLTSSQILKDIDTVEGMADTVCSYWKNRGEFDLCLSWLANLEKVARGAGRSDFEVRRIRAHLEYERGNLAEALKLLDSVELDAKKSQFSKARPWIHLGKAFVLLPEGKLQEASQNLDLHNQLLPKNAEIRPWTSNIAPRLKIGILTQQGNLKEAKLKYDEFKTLKKKTVRGLTMEELWADYYRLIIAAAENDQAVMNKMQTELVERIKNFPDMDYMRHFVLAAVAANKGTFKTVDLDPVKKIWGDRGANYKVGLALIDVVQQNRSK